MLTPCTGSPGERPRRVCTIRPRLVNVPPEPMMVAPVHSLPADRALELPAHLAPQVGHFLVGGALPGEVQLGEPHRAERQREGELDQAVHRADQLEAAAADVGDEGPLAGQMEVVRHRPVAERRLGFGVDDPERDVQLLAHPADEPGPVLGLPHRGGGHRRDPADAAALADLAHPGRAPGAPGPSRLLEAAGAGEPRREAGVVLELVDDGEAGGGIVLGDQQTDGVRADVDGGDPLARGGGGRRGSSPAGVMRAGAPPLDPRRDA